MFIMGAEVPLCWPSCKQCVQAPAISVSALSRGVALCLLSKRVLTCAMYSERRGITFHQADANVDPALVATNGYDFTNNANGDTYVWLLGDSLDSWNGARKEFVTLAGGCPVLPDFAFGTWFTWWHGYVLLGQPVQVVPPAYS